VASGPRPMTSDSMPARERRKMELSGWQVMILVLGAGI
jgi:hypothetical protein